MVILFLGACTLISDAEIAGKVGAGGEDGSANDTNGEGRDADGDGITLEQGDCDDNDAAAFPGATEIWYDGLDQDCSGGSDFDQDGDGYDREAECDDTDAAIYPDASVADTWYDGVDQDCDGNDGDQDRKSVV